MKYSIRYEANSKKHKHFKWTPEEDALLINIVNSSNSLDWEVISSKMFKRNARQCKERWLYYLCPEVNNGVWSKEEDELLRQKVQEYGSKWQKITQFFKGRTNTNCKNRWIAMKREAQKNPKPSTPHDIQSNVTSNCNTIIDDTSDELLSNLGFPDEDLNWDFL